MHSIKKMQDVMSLILTLGTLFSLFIVVIGGSLYLFQHGGNNLQTELIESHTYNTNIFLIWKTALSLTPLGIIELGLLALIATQIVRVGLLVWFYFVIHDYWFTLMSLFIFITLLYGFIWRN